MWMSITHRTACRFGRPIPWARIEFRVLPVNLIEQSILKLRFSIEPLCALTERIDGWGNLYKEAVWNSPIESWQLAVDLVVNGLRENPFDFPPSAPARPIPPPGASEWPPETLTYQWSERDNWDTDPRVELWARESTAGMTGAFQKVHALMRRIHEEFTFRHGVTDVKTAPGEILQLRMGVCQDFATLLIAAARSLGLPARYVSGYVYEGPRSKRSGPAPVGHGWAEVYFPEIGWRGFDALNGILACHTHIHVAHGRWYADAAPVIGRLGGVSIEQSTVTEIQVDRADSDGRIVEEGS